MAEVDTSSYAKPVPGKSMLDTAQQLGTMQQQQQQIQQGAINIDKSKLDLMNTHFQIMQNELSTLANDPQATKEEVLTRMHRIGDTFNMPQPVRDQMDAEFSDVPAKTPLGKDGTGNPMLSRKLDLIIKRGMDTNQRLNSQMGQNVNIDDGSTVTPGRQYMRGGPVPSGAPIARQNPPNLPTYDDNGQPRYQGVQPPTLPAGTVQAPGGFPSQYVPAPAARPSLPVAPINTAPPANAGSLNLTGPGKTITGVDTQPAPFASRFAAATGPASGPPPLFEEGKKAYTEDQTLGAQKLTAIKPALLALDLIPGLRSGPGTETYNKAVAALKANNIISTSAKDDPTAVYQEVNKYLSQYLKGRGGRSDADLQMAEQSSPNVGIQINPALEKLTRTAVAQDRIEAARAGAFEGTAYQKYGAHRANFPAKMDERAFIIDKLPTDERQALGAEMLKKKNTPEGKRFWDSVEVAKKTGVLGPIQQ